MNSSIDSPYPQAPRRTYLRRSSSTIGSFATALSSLTPPTEDDIPLRELSRQNVPKAIRNVSRLQGASYEKHTFLDFTYVTAPVGTRHPLAIPVRLLAGMKVTATLCPCMNSMDMATVQLAMQTTTDIILMTITALASALPAKYHTLINIATLTFGKAFPAAGRGRTRCRRNPHLLAHRVGPPIGGQ